MNLKQWCVVVNTYCSDYNGFFGPAASSQYDKWYNWLRPYYSPGETRWNAGKPVQKSKILLCPMASAKFWSDETTGTTPKTQSAFIAWGVYPPTTTGYMVHGACGSYGANTWATYSPTEKLNSEKYWQTINVPNGNTIPLIGDCANIGGRPNTDTGASITPPEWDGHWADGSAPPASSAYSITRFVLNRHNRGTNMVFFDCTVRPIPLKENWSLRWERTWDLSNPYTIAGGVKDNEGIWNTGSGDAISWMANDPDF
jgi:prepilin-type processing-associated H-X9-DG protein